MIWLVLACSLGLPLGFLLMGRTPLCRNAKGSHGAKVSIIIPARNEERNLPILLQSLRQSSLQPEEVLVVDDGSHDRTADVARSFGARVLSSQELPAGWTGKTWACHQGASQASGDVLIFLDADTCFVANGYEKLVSHYSAQGAKGTVLSVLPFHIMERPYEELSIFFNLLMAMGAGGFGSIGRPKLFGQSLLIARETYQAAGGHSSVRRSILENLALSARIEAMGGRCECIGGRGVLNIRMFPEGFAQLLEGWTKAFADGAAALDPAVLATAILWLATLVSSFLLLLIAPGLWRACFALLYASFVLQLAWLSRQLGNYSLLSCVFYPVPLLFYFVVFGQSLYRRTFKRQVRWRGRSI